ncbi:MAG: YHS domain-containing (seleno)protein [Pseudomonadota bacterium]
MRLKSLLVCAAILAFSGAARADVIHQTSFGGVAIDGYDAVAYFTQSAAIEGDDAFESDWNGATWRFASAANKALFDADPEKYAPQYGGYCAYAAARNYIAGTDPEAWSVVDGKLYLNYSKGIRSSWESDVPGQIAQGDRNWPGLRAQLED